MKKVLILAYDFPPYNSIGGQRPYSWFKYFKEFGWEPIVVTRHWDANVQNPVDYIKPSSNQHVSTEQTVYGSIIRAPFCANLRDKMLLKYGLNKYSYLRKVLTFIFQLLEFFISFQDNRRVIYKVADDFLKSNKVDAIIATGEPFILFKYAHKLSKKHNVPWVADYRDGWSANYNRGKNERLFYKVIEKNIVKSCALITTVSNEFQLQLTNLHSNKVIHVIKNGYFPELFESLTEQKSKSFKIGFAGTLYRYQPIEDFAKAIISLIKSHFKVQVSFFGIEYYPEQLERVMKAFYGYEAYIQTTPRLAHKVVIEELNNCHLLLLPASPDYAQLYAKVFDYMALKKRVLLYKNDFGALEEIFKETNCGIICNELDDVEDVISDAYAEWQQTGQVACNSRNIEQYSRKNQTKKLAEILNSL